MLADQLELTRTKKERFLRPLRVSLLSAARRRQTTIYHLIRNVCIDTHSTRFAVAYISSALRICDITNQK